MAVYELKPALDPKKMSYCLSEECLIIVSNCLFTGALPNDLKMAVIRSFPKKVIIDYTALSNYCPF